MIQLRDFFRLKPYIVLITSNCILTTLKEKMLKIDLSDLVVHHFPGTTLSYDDHFTDVIPKMTKKNDDDNMIVCVRSTNPDYQKYINFSIPKIFASYVIDSGSIFFRLTEVRQKIVGINASNCSLKGAVPEFLLKIETISVVNLSDNKLTGKLSSNVFCANRCSCQYQKFILLGSNELEGQVPAIGCNRLKILDLSRNYFDSLHKDILYSHTETDLFVKLKRNRINGSFPIVRNQSVRFLDLSHNDLTKFPKFAIHDTQKQGLKIFVNDNRIGGSLHIKNSNLTHLDANHNEITDVFIIRERPKNGLKAFFVGNKIKEFPYIIDPKLELIDLSHNTSIAIIGSEKIHRKFDNECCIKLSGMDQIILSGKYINYNIKIKLDREDGVYILEDEPKKPEVREKKLEVHEKKPEVRETNLKDDLEELQRFENKRGSYNSINFIMQPINLLDSYLWRDKENDKKKEEQKSHRDYLEKRQRIKERMRWRQKE